MIGWKISRHFLDQSEVKPKPIVTCPRVSRAWRVIVSTLDCLRLLYLVWVITLVLVLRHLIENRSITKWHQIYNSTKRKRCYKIKQAEVWRWSAGLQGWKWIIVHQTWFLDRLSRNQNCHSFRILTFLDVILSLWLIFFLHAFITFVIFSYLSQVNKTSLKQLAPGHYHENTIFQPGQWPF